MYNSIFYIRIKLTLIDAGQSGMHKDKKYYVSSGIQSVWPFPFGTKPLSIGHLGTLSFYHSVFLAH